MRRPHPGPLPAGEGAKQLRHSIYSSRTMMRHAVGECGQQETIEISRAWHGIVASPSTEAYTRARQWRLSVIVAVTLRGCELNTPLLGKGEHRMHAPTRNVMATLKRPVRAVSITVLRVPRVACPPVMFTCTNTAGQASSGTRLER